LAPRTPHFAPCGLARRGSGDVAPGPRQNAAHDTRHRVLAISPWRSFAWRGLKVLAIGVGIAPLFALAQPHKLGISMAYAVPITFGCWFFIDAGRLLSARWALRRNPHAHPQWPGWPWMAGVLVVGTVLGYQTGHSIGNLVTGQNAPGCCSKGRCGRLAGRVLAGARRAGHLLLHAAGSPPSRRRPRRRNACRAGAAAAARASSSRTCCSTRWPTCVC
jgi:hypothetical protein